MRRRDLSLSRIYNEIRADFRAGKDTRFTSRLSGISSMGSGADYHYRNEVQFLHMLERARHYQRNDPIVGQGIRRVVSNVVQGGFPVDPRTGDEGLDRELKSRWEDWSTDPDQCHSEGELSFGQMEQLALSTTLVDGDLLSLPLRTGALQFVEAHRLRTPRNTKRNVVHGVLMDSRARRLEYWVTKEDLDPYQSLSKVGDIRAIPARDSAGNRQVFHVYNPYRFSQRRGVTALAPISDTIGQHDDIQFATLVKAQIAALIVLFRKRGSEWQHFSDQQKGDRETETDGSYTRTIEGISTGLEIAGDPDEELQGFAPNIPSPEFFPHAMMVLTFISINLGIPVAVLLLDPSQTNFSGWRGAVDQARLGFKQCQNWLCQKFHQPVYRWKVRQWMEQDTALSQLAVRDGISIYRHRFNVPGFPYIEPLKDAGADLLQTRNALNSHRRVQAARGRDWEEVSSELIEDNASAIRKAIDASDAITNETGVEVHWRELLSLPTPDGVTVDISEEEELPQNEPTSEFDQRHRFNGRH